MMKIVGMRIEKYISDGEFGDNEDPIAHIMDRYILYAINKEIHIKLRKLMLK